MFEQASKNVDDILFKEAGCTTELDYTEQTSWLLFLKFLDSLEQDLADEAALDGKKYNYILDKPYRWESWAAPKDKDGKLDHNKALTDDDLRDFVNQKLFPYLHGFKQRASGPNTIEYKIGEIFGGSLSTLTEHPAVSRFARERRVHRRAIPPITCQIDSAPWGRGHRSNWLPWHGCGDSGVPTGIQL